MTTQDITGPEAAQRLADDLEIRNLVARFAHLADGSGPDDLDEYMDVFTENATWGAPGHERRGRADILEGAQERRRKGQLGPGTHSQHIVTTQAVRFEGPDSAVSDSYYLMLSDTAATPAIRGSGRYHDVLRREDGRWKIASREIVPG